MFCKKVQIAIGQCLTVQDCDEFAECSFELNLCLLRHHRCSLRHEPQQVDYYLENIGNPIWTIQELPNGLPYTRRGSPHPLYSSEKGERLSEEPLG